MYSCKVFNNLFSVLVKNLIQKFPKKPNELAQRFTTSKESTVKEYISDDQSHISKNVASKSLAESEEETIDVPTR